MISDPMPLLVHYLWQPLVIPPYEVIICSFYFKTMIRFSCDLSSFVIFQIIWSSPDSVRDHDSVCCVIRSQLSGRFFGTFDSCLMLPCILSPSLPFFISLCVPSSCQIWCSFCSIVLSSILWYSCRNRVPSSVASTNLFFSCFLPFFLLLAFLSITFPFFTCVMMMVMMMVEERYRRDQDLVCCGEKTMWIFTEQKKRGIQHQATAQEKERIVRMKKADGLARGTWRRSLVFNGPSSGLWCYSEWGKTEGWKKIHKYHSRGPQWKLNNLQMLQDTRKKMWWTKRSERDWGRGRERERGVDIKVGFVILEQTNLRRLRSSGNEKLIRAEDKTSLGIFSTCPEKSRIHSANCHHVPPSLILSIHLFCLLLPDENPIIPLIITIEHFLSES